jgi:peptidoglycan/LPS O-acetylase OafA/YrhL
MILGLGLLGAFRRPGVFPAALLVFLALYGLRAALGPLLAPPEPVDSFARLALPFLIGSALFFYRRFVPLSWPLAIGGFVLVFAIMGASGPTPLSQVVLTVALVYATFVAAYLPGGAVRRYNAIGDYSYGVYLYAWPVQQAMASLTGPVWPVVNMVIAAPIVLGCATLSWRFVEKPALDARRSVAAAIERFVRRVRLRLSPA